MRAMFAVLTAIFVLAIGARAENVYNYNYTGGVQTFTVPTGVTSISVDAYGANGTSISDQYLGTGRLTNSGKEYSANQGIEGRGGRVQSVLTVAPGDILNIYVGGTNTWSGSRFDRPHTGWNGGGSGSGVSGLGFDPNSGGGGGRAGGGATDIRIGGNLLTDRVIVAGGGGGGRPVFWCRDFAPVGGDGGGLQGGDGGHGRCYDWFPDEYGRVSGDPTTLPNAYGGKGGAQSQWGWSGDGGTGKDNGGISASGENGSLGGGGKGGGGQDEVGYTGSGGGGGYYGGGGGGSEKEYFGRGSGGGGGGSSYTHPNLAAPIKGTFNSLTSDFPLFVVEADAKNASVDGNAAQSTTSYQGYQLWKPNDYNGTFTSDEATVHTQGAQLRSRSSSSETDSDNRNLTAVHGKLILTFTAPVITVISGTDIVEQGATWTDAGATADGGETVTVSGAVNENTGGTYTITYTATDAAGNAGTATRTVTVVDTTAPVITVTSGTDTVEQGSTWTNAGATANTGETVTASGTVNTSTSGTYTITYTATDAAGNTGTATRTVTVVDTTAPVITVTPGADTVERGGSWTDAGATADTGEIVTASGTVDTSAAGTYTVTYTATDAAGNVAMIR